MTDNKTDNCAAALWFLIFRRANGHWDWLCFLSFASTWGCIQWPDAVTLSTVVDRVPSSSSHKYIDLFSKEDRALANHSNIPAKAPLWWCFHVENHSCYNIARIKGRKGGGRFTSVIWLITILYFGSMKLLKKKNWWTTFALPILQLPGLKNEANTEVPKTAAPPMATLWMGPKASHYL